jgi:hypothetical protein
MRAFGRFAELQALKARLQRFGVTFVIGPPRIGKTQVIRAVCRSEKARLDKTAWYGYAESTSDATDVVLRSLSTAFEQWINSATFRQQAGMLVHSLKSQNLSASLLGLADALSATVLTQSTEVVRGVGQWLRSEDKRMLLGSELEKLPIDTLKERIQALAAVSGRRIVLGIDAVDLIQDPLPTISLLRSLLSNRAEWSDSLHFLVGLRSPEEQAILEGPWRQLEGFPGVDVQRIGRFNLVDDDERQAFVSYIRNFAPAANNLDDQSLIDLVDGSPAVLDEWRLEAPATVTEMRRQAINAQVRHYDDCVLRVRELAVQQSEHADALIKILLLPRPVSVDDWQAAAPTQIVARDAVADNLRARLLLDPHESTYPSFGHITRYEAARRALIATPAAGPNIRRNLGDLVSALLRDTHTDEDREKRRARIAAGLADLCEQYVVEYRLRALARGLVCVEEHASVVRTLSIAQAVKVAQSEDVAGACGLILAEAIDDAIHNFNSQLAVHWLHALVDLAVSFPSPKTLQYLCRALMHYAGWTRAWSSRTIAMNDLRDLASMYQMPVTQRHYAWSLSHAACIGFPLNQFVPGWDYYARELRRYCPRRLDDEIVAAAFLRFWHFVGSEACKMRDLSGAQWAWRHLLRYSEKSRFPRNAREAIRDLWQRLNLTREWFRDDRTRVLERCRRIGMRRAAMDLSIVPVRKSDED